LPELQVALANVYGWRLAGIQLFSTTYISWLCFRLAKYHQDMGPSYQNV